MRILVIGGNLFIGRLLVNQLLEQGHELSILHRRDSHPYGPHVQNLQADRNDPEAVKAAIGDARFDVVFDNVYDWERGTTAEQVRGCVPATQPDRLHRYVFMSSVAAYFEGLDHIESDPLAPADCPDVYARNKALSERALFRMHQKSGFPIVTFRPPYIYGPGNPFYREAFFWDRLLLDRPIVMPGDGSRLMQFVHVQDLVTCLIRAMEEPSAVGEAFNVAQAEPVTQLEVLEALAAAAGKTPEIVYVPRDLIEREGGGQTQEPLYFGFYFDMPPITTKIAKAQDRLHFEPIPFAEGLEQTFAAYLESGVRRTEIDFGFEDRLIALAGKRS
ncbi:MAG: NAD-dependent epimerase/dehydratase family protein [Bryobacterales bacterium]|nr:NAD-dependent epimerase/dehydratase family protein [Bryobacterales bacterium]